MLDALACLAVSTLWWSRARIETLLPGDWGFYNQVPVGASMLAALLLDVVGLAAVGFLAVLAVRRLRRPGWRRVAAVAAAATFLIALNAARLAHSIVGASIDALGPPWLLALAVLGLAASSIWPRRALRSIRWVALIVSPLAAFTIVHTLWMFLELAAGPVWRRADPVPLGRTPPSLRRVVWLVFGELDQRIAFEARPAGLELPALDRLRRESVYAGAARPPAGTPEVSMPALITGQAVVAVSPVNHDDLQLTFADGKTGLLSAQLTMFSRARALGYDTAVIGWDLPYPRVFGGALGTAAFRPSEVHEQVRGESFRQTLGNHWASLVPPVHVRRLLVARVTELSEQALRTAADERFGLVLIHLPIPRTPGVYDAATGRITPWNFTGAAGGYLDNLALADRFITELRRGLDRARLGDRTWLIVTAERWWRMSWRYDGGVDRRVPFLLRPPEGGRTTHVDAAFNTLAGHELALAILRGSIADGRAAAAWLARNPVAPPRDYTPEGQPIY